MKTIASILFTILVLTAAAQDDQALKQAQMKQNGGWHGFLTVFTGGLEFNFCHQRLLDFLEAEMRMTEADQQATFTTITSTVKQRTSEGNSAKMIIKYRVHSKDGYFYIDGVSITGDYKRVIELFLKYWPTTIKDEQIKPGEWVYCHLMPDRIGLYATDTGTARIEITNSQK